MVCDEGRWCVGVWQSSVWNMVCVKVVCERERVTKLCVKDGVWPSGVWKMVWRKMMCDKVVCERWCGERWCVWQSYVWKMVWWKMVCDKVVCERWCVTKWCVKEGVSKMVPRLPRKTMVDVSLCHTCHVKMKVDVTKYHACHANSRGVTGDKSGPSAPPSPISATSATQNDGGCKFVPRLPREMKVDVTKYHACHANSRGVTGDKSGPSAPPSPKRSQKCHVCHARRRWMWVCTTPAPWNEGGCHQVPRLPRKQPRRHGRQIRTKRATQCHKCHACHAKRRWMWVCATPATWNEGGCHQVLRLPRKVSGRHRRQIRTKRATQYHECHACQAKRRWMWECATPATWNEGGCHQVPRLPRKQPRRHGRQIRTKRATQCHKCHVCHAKRRWMWVCATPATRNEGGCHQVPCLPRKQPRRHGRQIRTKRATQCHKCHVCHAKRRWMWVCATPATRNEGGCHQVPCLPRKQPRRHGRQIRTKRAASTMSATPATQNDRGCQGAPRGLYVRVCVCVCECEWS